MSGSEMSDTKIRALMAAADPARGIDTKALLPDRPDVLVSAARLQVLPKRVWVPARRRRARLAMALALALLMLAATAATWIYIATRPSAAPSAVACFQTLDANASRYGIGVPEGKTPAEACADRWQSMFDSPAPPLVSCIIGSGGNGVFPNPDGLSPTEACSSVGGSLPEQGATYGGLTADQVKALQTDLQTRYAGIRTGFDCAGLLDLKSQISQALQAAGASGWQVVDQTTPTESWPFPDGRSAVIAVPKNPAGQACADYGVDPGSTTIFIHNGLISLPSESPTP